MKTRLNRFAAMLVVAGLCRGGGALVLEDCAVNLDGVTTFLTAGQALPSEVDARECDLGTGLGTISVRIAQPGSHYVAVLVDHDFETATDLVRGPWVGSEGVRLDESGTGVVFVKFGGSDLARFYRVRQE